MIKSFLSLIFAFLCCSTTSALAYSVDFTGPASLTQLRCLQNSNYKAVMTRVLNSDGQVDNDGINTLSAIQKNGLGIKTIPYIVPQPNVGDGAIQVDKMYNALKANNVNYDTIYIQLDPTLSSWSFDSKTNMPFLLSMAQRIAGYGKTVGILGAAEDWWYVTGNANSLVPNTVLWYFRVHGPGVTGESQPNFNDFVPFGPFSKSTVRIKQFAIQEFLCGLWLNRDVLA